MSNMIVAEVKSVSGKPLFEVQHVNGYLNSRTGETSNQTLSEPFTLKTDADEHMAFLQAVRGTERDPLADYWRRRNTKLSAHFFGTDEGSDDPRAIEGGGGPSEKLVGVVRNSRHLIEAYVRAYYNRYGDRLVVRYYA